jgi:hypothetical protein
MKIFSNFLKHIFLNITLFLDFLIVNAIPSERFERSDGANDTIYLSGGKNRLRGLLIRVDRFLGCQ